MNWEANREWDRNRAGVPRWADEAIAAVGGEDQVKRAGGISDYQGWGALLTHDNRVLAWYYGSCSGCDGYEDLVCRDWENDEDWTAYEKRQFEAVVDKLRGDIETFSSSEAAEERFVEAIERGW